MGKTTVSNNMTVENCADICAAGQYSLFGVEYSSECYCGNMLAVGSVAAPASDCKYACSGDKTETCGGDWRFNYYEFGYTPAPSSTTSSATSATSSATSTSSTAASPTAPAGYTDAGCYTEATGQRALTGKSYFDDSMTVEKCAAACTGYEWFGVEYGRECYCGNTINDGSVPTARSECSTPCPGNSAETYFFFEQYIKYLCIYCGLNIIQLIGGGHNFNICYKLKLVYISCLGYFIFSCFIRYLVLSYIFLGYFILSYIILGRLILRYLNFSYFSHLDQLVISYLTLNYLILSYLIRTIHIFIICTNSFYILCKLKRSGYHVKYSFNRFKHIVNCLFLLVSSSIFFIHFCTYHYLLFFSNSIIFGLFYFYNDSIYLLFVSNYIILNHTHFNHHLIHLFLLSDPLNFDNTPHEHFLCFVHLLHLLENHHLHRRRPNPNLQGLSNIASNFGFFTNGGRPYVAGSPELKWVVTQLQPSSNFGVLIVTTDAIVAANPTTMYPISCKVDSAGSLACSSTSPNGFDTFRCQTAPFKLLQ
ncbi:putative fungistatic metabolite [Glarea lozoyensis 74030]|uniref:Putative fungistatic metabolite n=1 Tax=Glarea lozoyensis (strain ATCC 74030 / MF5533) TaxID=1104152 RepID=H0EXD7_GLAL7|nr:putative fungistatic metabolite [Glarea lozoyensis 74030]